MDLAAVDEMIAAEKEKFARTRRELEAELALRIDRLAREHAEEMKHLLWLQNKVRNQVGNVSQLPSSALRRQFLSTDPTSGSPRGVLTAAIRNCAMAMGQFTAEQLLDSLAKMLPAAEVQDRGSTVASILSRMISEGSLLIVTPGKRGSPQVYSVGKRLFESSPLSHEIREEVGNGTSLRRQT